MMKSRIPYFLLLSVSLFPLTSFAAPEVKSNLPKEIRDFLGEPSKDFSTKYLKPAQQLRKAIEHRRDKKLDLAVKELTPIADQSEMAEHALYEFSLALREKKQFSRSSSQATKLLHEFPNTPYGERARDLIVANDCDHSLVEAERAKGKTKKLQAARLLRLCLAKTPWKEWPLVEKQADALFEILKSEKDPLLGSYVTELIEALPSNSPIRVKISKSFAPVELQKFTEVARFRLKSNAPAGVRAQFPDAELVDVGMKAAAEENWKATNEAFKKLVTDFPQSEHIDRAQYWIARSEEKLGNEEEAKKRYNEIFTANPLTYYGLQSALRLKKDLNVYLTPAPNPIPKMEGSLLTQQSISLSRLRALMEVGLIDLAREEAKFLFQHKPGGYTFGQKDPQGALMVAYLFQLAGYQMGAFSHAYAALSLDSNVLNNFTLDLIFPQQYLKEFEAASNVTGVHHLLLLSLAKQESAFLPNATSRANAYGLMQLLLPTAQEVDEKIQLEDLFNPAVNTIAGSRYLQKLLDRFQGNIALALAGYNAGPSRAQQWQKQMLEYSAFKQSFDVEIFIDMIPFKETRGYVASILRNYAWYKLMHRDGTLSNVQELAFQWQKQSAPEPVKELPPDPAKVVPTATPPTTPKSMDTSGPTAGL